MNTENMFVAGFVIDPAYKLAPTQRENITKQVRVFRRAVTQPNNNQTTLTATLRDPIAAPTHAVLRDTALSHAYYNTNTVDPDMDLDGSAEFDDCLGEEQEARAYGLTIMDDATFFQTYCE